MDSHQSESSPHAVATADTQTPQRMQAVCVTEYGGPENLLMKEVFTPQWKDSQVLIRVHAASVNPIDWRIRSGSLRLLLPTSLPFVPGFDVAGEVVDLGRDAANKGWSRGDEVFCFLDNMHGGGYAPYAVASAEVLARKPANLSFEEAAAVPLAGITALQSLRNIGRIAEGMQVLINGAAGGVGTFAVQIAKIFGAEVTGVSGKDSFDLVRELGADHVLDYHSEDFTEAKDRYHIILDAVAKRSYWDCRESMKDDGCYITTVPSPSNVTGNVATLFGNQRCRHVLGRPNGQDLNQLADWLASGKLRSIVERTYPLAEAAEAHRESEQGHVHGKIVLKVRN